MQNSILLSIKPQFVELILTGSKQFEFRRVLFRDRSVTRVVIYASYPVKKVVGEFRVGYVLSLSPDELWNATRNGAGIEKGDFFSYFEGRKTAHAIKIEYAHRYRKPRDLIAEYNVHRAPQSFLYLGRVERVNKRPIGTINGSADYCRESCRTCCPEQCDGDCNRQFKEIAGAD